MNRHIISVLAFSVVAALATRAENVTAHGSLGMLDAPLMTKTFNQVGMVNVWNTTQSLKLSVAPGGGYLMSKVYVYISMDPPPLKTPEELYVEPDFGTWPYSRKFKVPTTVPYCLDLSFENDLAFEWGHWGPMWLEKRLITVAVRVELKSTDAVPVTLTAWALNPNVPLSSQQTAWGDNAWAMRYEVQHPHHGQFVDAPVNGLRYKTATQEGVTGTDGGFWYFPGEYVTFNIGDVLLGFAKADQRLTPLDILPALDTEDAPVANMARLLQSLDADGEPNGSIEITIDSAAVLEGAMQALGVQALDFGNTGQMDAVIATAVQLGRNLEMPLTEVSAADAIARLEQSAGASLMRRNISKTPEYAVDKPKLDIIPVWVPARKANGEDAVIEYRDAQGALLETRTKAKPLLVTYEQERDPAPGFGERRASDIYTAVSMDDGATWKRFNVSHMAWHSSFTLDTGEKYPGNCRAPQQKIAENKILVVWTSAYARGGKPSVSIKTDDDYPYDDAYAVRDFWGVRGRQGSVNYDLDDDVADQGIGEIPYHALWACRGILVTDAEHRAGKFTDVAIGEIVWFKPERLTSGRRDAFIPVVGSAKNAGFGIAWQEDPGGLRPGKCSAGGHGWSGATVHKKTDIWYSFIRWADFDRIDANFVPSIHATDEHGEDSHSQQPEISNRPKWLVPMSLPVRVSDNNTVNTENMRVQLDANGLPVRDANGAFIPLAGAEESDWIRHEHEHDGECGGGEVTDPDEGDHEGEGGTGGGWGMARYAYMHPGLAPLADLSGANLVWDASVNGEFRPADAAGCRWYRFVNQPGVTKTVVVTPDGRVLDGDTGACRPNLTLLPFSYIGTDGKTVNSAWAMLGYEETKGLGTPPDEDHHDVVAAPVLGAEFDEDAEESGDKGKDVIYHSFRFDAPDLVSAGDIVNLPALDDSGNLIPIFYKDAVGVPTPYIRQFATENARRVRFLAQSKGDMLKTAGADTVALVLYKQGREGNGKPSDIFAVRVVVPTTDKAIDNPYRFANFARFDTSESNPDENGFLRYRRKHMNMTSATVEAVDPLDIAEDFEGHAYGKVARWNQYAGNLADESFANPYSDAKGHRGFIRGNVVVLGYSFTPNWGRLGGDHLDFFVRRSFDGGRSWTTDPNGPEETVHTIIEKDPVTREYVQKQYRYRRGQFEPARNVSLLKGNRFTVTDPRLVPPMGPGTVNPTYPQDDTFDPDTYYVVFGTAEVIHGIADPRVTDTVKADIFYTRTTDAGTTWLMEPWVINPDSSSPDAGETVYRFPVMAQGTAHQGHAQIRMHPSGTRLYTIWHQFTDGDELHVSPHDVGNDIWFRRVDFMGVSE